MSKLTTQYRCIGRGFCGSVWALRNDDTTPTTAIKREDGGPGRSLTNDYTMHIRLLSSAQNHAFTSPLSIPHCHNLIQPTDDSWWLERLPRFPKGYTACRALISDRIPPVPRHISDKIVDLFCADNVALSSFVKSNPDDEACLIRPYLGRRRRRRRTGGSCEGDQRENASTSRFQRFSLRNVPLHVDQMEKLGFDVNAYGEGMAEGLALMHWGAGIDANDVEFVLAPPLSTPSSLSSGALGENGHKQHESNSPASFESEYLGSHRMWILDFDCCREMSMDEKGVEQACEAFFKK